MEVTHWPLYALRLRTPRLELRLPALDELDALAQLAYDGVHDPATMPFDVPWTDQPPAERARSVMQFHWRQLAEWKPEAWDLPLTVFLDGRPAGCQSVGARDFAILQQVETGSWLGRRFQGRGIGTEMRAAVLHLAFEGLHARTAVSAAMTDNHASAAVSRKLGYRENGLDRTRVRDGLGHQQRFVLDRDQWRRHRSVRVRIEGLEPGRPLFGAVAPAA